VKVFFVAKRLAFGSAITTWPNVERLQDLGITHVINLQRNKNNKKVRQFEWLWLPFKDDKKARPRWFYKRALKFRKRAVRKRGNKIFVMCHHGISRSASMTYFLLRASGFRSSKAESAIRRVRPCAIIVPAYRQSGEEYLLSK
jgi:protein-tyrosine phosphatase